MFVECKRNYHIGRLRGLELKCDAAAKKRLNDLLFMYFTYVTATLVLRGLQDGQFKGISVVC